MRKCYYCGTIFTPSFSSVDSVACPNCAKSNPKTLNADRYRIIACKQCGLEFVGLVSKNPMFCSRSCYQDYQKSVPRPACKMSDDEKQESRTVKNCLVCGNPIGPDRGFNAKTCCRSCSKKLGSIRTRVATFGDKSEREQQGPTKKKTKFTLGEISRICAALHIQYAEYQKLEKEDGVEALAEKMGVDLQKVKKPKKYKPILKNIN